MNDSKTIFVTRQIPGEGIELLKREFSVEVSDIDEIVPRHRLIDQLADIDGLLCHLKYFPGTGGRRTGIGSSAGGCWIAGAGLDVFEHEPRVEEGLIGSDQVVLTPHIGSASRVTREKMSMLAAQNLRNALLGRVPPYPVNPEALSHWQSSE